MIGNQQLCDVLITFTLLYESYNNKQYIQNTVRNVIYMKKVAYISTVQILFKDLCVSHVKHL